MNSFSYPSLLRLLRAVILIIFLSTARFASKNLKFGKIDVSRSPKTAEKYNVISSVTSRTLPTLILFKEGQASIQRPLMDTRKRVIPFSFSYVSRLTINYRQLFWSIRSQTNGYRFKIRRISFLSSILNSFEIFPTHDHSLAATIHSKNWMSNRQGYCTTAAAQKRKTSTKPMRTID